MHRHDHVRVHRLELVDGVVDVVRRREAELESLRADYEGRLGAMQGEQQADQADRLRRRLLQLAGYGEGQAS